MGARIFLSAAVACIAGGVAGVALAEDAFNGAAPVDAAALDEIRGGFELPENLRASFTLERTAHLNGERVAHLVVEIPDIARMTAEQASALAEAADVLVIQNGPNNAFNLTDLGPAATVIQNTLNDQRLVALTTLSVSVNTLGAYQDMNFHDGLSQLLGNVTGVR